MDPKIVNYKPVKHNEIGVYKEKKGWFVWSWLNGEHIEGPFSENDAKKKANEILEAAKSFYAAMDNLGK